MKASRGKLKRLFTVTLALMLITLTASAAMAEAANGGEVRGRIALTKKITGQLPAEQTFKFKLQAKDGAPMPSDAVNGVAYASLKTKTGGEVSFGDITYTNAGYYEYALSEEAGAQAAMKYDPTVYDATVLVIWKDGRVNGTLAIAATWFIRQGDAEQAKINGAVFTNAYTPKSVDVDPPVRKAVTGDAPSAAGTFKFRMAADKSSFPMPEGSVNGVKEVTLVGAGEVEFGLIHYTEAGKYTYKVSEVSGNAQGYTYDDVIYTMTVTVKDDNGALKAERVITRGNGATATEMLFTNKYTARSPGGDADATPKPGEPGPDSPKTGDASYDALWKILLAASALGIAAASRRERKRKR